MKNTVVAALVLTVLSGSVLKAEDAAQPPGPQKEHEWLQQLVGEWDTEAEMIVEPGQPPQKCSGTETVRSIGGLWTVAESRGTFMEIPVTGIMTLGYDPQKKKYIGTWIDSMNNYLWKYEGTLDKEGKALTLETEGPSPLDPGKTSKFKEVMTIKGKDHRVFTSSMQGEDGKWHTFMTANSRRKS